MAGRGFCMRASCRSAAAARTLTKNGSAPAEMFPRNEAVIRRPPTCWQGYVRFAKLRVTRAIFTLLQPLSACVLPLQLRQHEEGEGLCDKKASTSAESMIDALMDRGSSSIALFGASYGGTSDGGSSLGTPLDGMTPATRSARPRHQRTKTRTSTTASASRPAWSSRRSTR